MQTVFDSVTRAMQTDLPVHRQLITTKMDHSREEVVENIGSIKGIIWPRIIATFKTAVTSALQKRLQ